MKSYRSQQELIETIDDKLAKYLAEFETIPEELKNVRAEGVDKTPSENLSYQLGWVHLLLSWEEEEKAGQKVEMPAPGYKWNNLGGLYQSFYDQYGQLTLAEQREQLQKAVRQLCSWLETLSDQEFFEPEQRKYASNKARWPLWKWVHINTVAPFTNFRTQIRKWKRLTL